MATVNDVLNAVMDPTLRKQLKIAFSGFTATAAELNKLSGVTAGTVTASKAVVVSSIKAVDNLFFGTVASAALLTGGGTSATPLSTSGVAKNFIGFWCKSTDTGDDNRLAYLFYYASGIGGGFEAVRGKVVGTVTGLNDIRGGNFTAGLDSTTSNISGMATGVQATFEALAATKTIGGTIAALTLTSFVATGNTLPATAAFIRCVDEGTVPFTVFANLSAVDTNTLYVTKSSASSTHGLKVLVNGAVKYIMLCA